VSTQHASISASNSASRSSPVRVLSDEVVRNARLLGLPEPDGRERLPGVLSSRRVPSRLLRNIERVRVKLGLHDWAKAWLEPVMRARSAMLGADATGPPRFLVRVDEFPYSTAYYDEPAGGLQASRAFHGVMHSAGMTYLMALLPEPALDPLNPDAAGTRQLRPEEVELIGELHQAGVEFAQHGTTHRTRHASPRRRSELAGLTPSQLSELLDRGRATLGELGIKPRVFVPPFNRFAPSQYGTLAERFDVVCGGPESVALMGFHGGPLWRGDAVYLPCYAPLYGPASTILPEARRLIELAPGSWIPIVLHTGWESRDSFRSLARLAGTIAPFACSWRSFLDAVDRSKAPERAGGA